MSRFVVLAVFAGCLTASLAGCTSSASKPRGAVSAQAAATDFVTAIDAGNGAAAAAISCTAFGNEARGAATSGADPGISFSVSSVKVSGIAGTASLVQTLRVGGGRQTTRYTLILAERSKRWLVCGRS
jgi:hypothetical protein